jgi:hypothetical protein
MNRLVFLVLIACIEQRYWIKATAPNGERYRMKGNQQPHAGWPWPWQIPPLVSRELLVYSRQPWTYWLRLLSALGAVSVLAIMATTGQYRLGQADGLSLFAGSTVFFFPSPALTDCARLPIVSAPSEGRGL